MRKYHSASDRAINLVLDEPPRTETDPEPARHTASGAQKHLALPLTDTGNAEQLVRLFGKDIRYCSSLGWLVWDGKRWKGDAGELLSRMGKATARYRYDEAKGIENDNVRKAALAHARRSESRSGREAMIALAQSERGIPIRAEELDADYYALNVLNGTVDLRTGELRQHGREDLITKIVPVAYDPNATAPLWDAFLDRIFADNEDVTSFVQRAVGYSLTGDTAEQCLFICWGSGANGKSVFYSAISQIIGEYGQQARTETLMQRKNRGVGNDIAALRGARFVSAIEAERGERIAEALVKQLTGGDKVRARFLFREEFEFTPCLKLWLAVNHKPIISGADYAMRRRLRLIPFPVTIPEGERDSNLSKKLKRELSGILAWAIRGAVAWANKGLGEPAEIKTATTDYCDEMDELAAFLAECCEVGPGHTAQASGLYKAHKDWGLGSGEGSGLTQTAFGLMLGERGFTKKSTNRGVVYVGIKLREKTETTATTPEESEELWTVCV